jgi:hypothetical protein
MPAHDIIDNRNERPVAQGHLEFIEEGQEEDKDQDGWLASVLIKLSRYWNAPQLFHTSTQRKTYKTKAY